jgi:hypothetical protein
VDAQNAQNRTAIIVIDIEPKSAQNGGSVRRRDQRVDHALRFSVRRLE